MPPTAGIRAVAGANATDTVLALQNQALIVEVRNNDGKLAEGVVVRFEAQPPADTSRRFEPAVFVCSLSSPSCGNTYGTQFTTDTTDSQGRAKALIRLGEVAGRAVVRLFVPELGLVDSVAFTVTPGSVARVRSIAGDTALDIGATAMLRGYVTDLYNNRRTEQPAMSLGAGTAFTLDAATATVSAKDMGTQWLYARYGTLVDSMSVRAIPAGRLVVWAASYGEIRMIDTRGNGANRTLVTGAYSDFGTFPHFDAARQHVTLHRGSAAYGGPANTILVVDTATLVQRQVDATAGFPNLVAERQVSDGSLLVVGKRNGDASYGLWRVASDNTMSLVVDLPDLAAVYDGADISFDGSKLAYIATDGAYATQLQILDVQSGVKKVILASGRSPRWSPQADRLAYFTPVDYLDGKIQLINADGTGGRLLSNVVFSPGLAWSPDGAYIAGRTSAGLQLLRTSDGVGVLLRFRNGSGGFEDYYQPDWR